MRSSDILIVDDEIGIRNLLSEILQDEGYGVAVAENAETARKMRLETRPAMVLLDIWMPDCDGITLLKEWSQNGLLDMPVVMMSGHASIDTAVEATKIGALDFLEKPIALQKLLTTVKRALSYSKQQENTVFSVDKLGNGEVIRQLVGHLEKASKQDLSKTILLTGEPGSPFLLVAEYFHHRKHPWIAPNKEQWLKPAQDWMKAAHGGTLYLGNVAEYDIPTQEAILAVLSRRDNYKVRIVAASSQPLTELIVHSKFIEKLSDEISGISISIPPLRAHIEDLPNIIQQVLVQLVESKQVKLVRFPNATMKLLRQYNWPGNFTQLRQVIKSLALAADGDTVQPEHVNYVLEQHQIRYTDTYSGFNLNVTLRELRREVEKYYFEYHMYKEKNNMSKVAKQVGLERTHLYRKLKQLDITFPKTRGSNSNNATSEEDNSNGISDDDYFE